MKYEELIQQFSPSMIEDQFCGSLETGLNVCTEICDRFADTDKVALRYERIDGTRGEMTFKELQTRSAQFANYLTSLGIGKGDRVACLLPRTPELMITVLVHCVLVRFTSRFLQRLVQVLSNIVWGKRVRN